MRYLDKKYRIAPCKNQQFVGISKNMLQSWLFSTRYLGCLVCAYSKKFYWKAFVRRRFFTAAVGVGTSNDDDPRKLTRVGKTRDYTRM